MRTWMFSQNLFLNATDNSFVNAMKISTYHDNALDAVKDDPFFLGLYNTYHPLHVNYKTTYDTWLAREGTQEAGTLNLTQLLGLLSSTKILQWDSNILLKYNRSTPKYRGLLPNRRKPFQTGTQTDRVHAVKVLSDAIGTDEALADVKADIDSFYAQLEAAFNNQKANKSTGKSMSAELEDARVAMCTGMYANLGAIMQHFASDPGKIEVYFDLAAIRSHQQVLFTGHLKAGEVHTVVKHTFGANDEVTLTNNGNTQLKFYLAPAKEAQPGETFITLGHGEETVLASALGKLTDTYLIVLNTDANYMGEFGVEIE